MVNVPTIELRDNRIFLWTPRVPFGRENEFEQLKAMCKKVEGARWVKTAKAWSYPLDWPTCVALRKVWGQNLVIGHELREWAWTERRRRDELLTLAKLDSTELARVDAVSPVLGRALRNRTYQQVDAAWMARAGVCLLANQPGLGKTLEAMAAVVESGLDGPILVVAPAPAVDMTWLPEIRKWLPQDEVFACTGTRERRNRILAAAQPGVLGLGRRWVIVNPEMLEVPHDVVKKGKVVGYRDISYPALLNSPWAHIIADESHKMLITRTAMVKDQPFFRQGLGMLMLMQGGLRIAMSGTPFRGHLENLWGTLNWLQPARYTSYWRWVEKWFDWWEDAVTGARVVGGLKVHTLDEFYAELSSIMIRHTKEEVAPDLPPKAYAGIKLKSQIRGQAGIWLEMEPQQKKAYQQLVKDAVAELEGGTLLPDGNLAIMLRLKQFSSVCGKLDAEGELRPTLPSNKFTWLVNWLEERDMLGDHATASGGKVIIASQFSQVIDLFAKELWTKHKTGSLKITGGVSSAKRVEAKEQFQAEGGPKIMFLTTTAGGVSLTLDAADDVIFLDETWIPDDQEQVEDRAHRVSRMHRVTIWYLRSLGTIEHKIATKNVNLDTIQKFVMDGRRGVGTTTDTNIAAMFLNLLSA